MRTRFFGAMVLSISLLASNAFAVIGIKNNPLLTSVGGFSSFDQQPVINNNGDVVFSAVDSGGQSNVYFYSSQDGQVFRQDFGQVQPSKNRLAMNSGGQIGFVGNTTTGEAIYSKTASITGDGTVLTVQGNNFSGYTNPSVVDDGSMYFTAIDAGSKDAGYFRMTSGGQIITIIGAGDTSFVPTGDVAANNAGSFATVGADPNDGSLGIYSVSSSGAVITIMGSIFTGAGTLSVSRDASLVTWAGTISLSGSSKSALYIAHLGGGSVITISGANFGQCAIDSSGDVLVDQTDPASGERSLKTYFETGDIPTEELSIGDSLDGSTITNFSIGPNSLNDNGEFVFYAQLADGSSGVFTSFVPEPIVIAPLAGGLLLLRRRGNA